MNILEHPRVIVLDHGYVEYIEHMGSDERFIEAARMSVDKGFISWDPYPGAPKGDAGLLAHLWMNQHTTPFEMGGIIIEVKAPIMVYREWHRHRTQGYNEMSARYIPLPNENYVPKAGDIVRRSEAAFTSKNKQQRSATDRVCSLDEVVEWVDHYLLPSYFMAQQAYEKGLEIGVPKELARLSVPVARYSRMRAVANPLNWMKFLTLRIPKTAQEEIRLYAEAFEQNIFKPLFPRTHTLWVEGMAMWKEFVEWRTAKMKSVQH